MPCRTRFAALFGAVVLTALALGAPADTYDAAAPLPPEEAARTMIVPEGFHVTLFAGEPDVRQPIGFCIDDRGRLWVAEAYNYPNHGLRPGDRILIFEDTDGDGRFDKRTVFLEGLNYVTGIEVGFGGAWVVSPPYLYFVPDKNSDDIPDDKPVVLLDGFGTHANSHNLANALAWGPDGWLYGTHGRTNWSTIGKPGTPQEERIRFDGGVYRYHPVRHVWEPFADGTTNPWGIDWDDFGQAFVCNCVDPHLYHVIQGAHYEPWRNRESSRFAYERIGTIADHLHYVGKGSLTDGLGTPEEDAAGGGHAHCGTMVYLGDNWPERYRNTAFMHNLHGRRINNDILRRRGSGYTASHGLDLLRARDPWYMGVTLQYGPDGAVFASDWSDTGECHSVRNTRRETGRIYKISYGKSAPVTVDLSRLTDMELVALQRHRNDWHVRHARRNLQERAAQGHEMKETSRELRRRFAERLSDDRRLRYLWALHSIGEADVDFLLGLLKDESETIRGWAIRLLTDAGAPPHVSRPGLADLAAKDHSAFVGLHLASALQRMNLDDRWEMAETLVARSDFAGDANLPLMIWYGIEPLVQVDLPRFTRLSGRSEIPLVRRHLARRVAALPENAAGIEALLDVVADVESAEALQNLLDGILTGLEGTRRMAMPAQWPLVGARLKKFPRREIRERARRLALIFDDPAELQSMVAQATDPRAAPVERNDAIRDLVSKRASGFDSQLIELVRDPATRSAALRGLAEYNHPTTVATLLESYPILDGSARQDALQTLAARPAWASALLDAVERRQIPLADLTAFTARQIHSLGDKQLATRIEALWGPIRESPAERDRLITEYKKLLGADALRNADRSRGRLLFEKTCSNCHRLFGEGTAIGPDLTGAQRTNIDYLLQNLVDPSAAIAREFQMQVIGTTAGRVITGLVIAESDHAITVQTANEKIVVPLREIEERNASRASLMPEGLLQHLTRVELRDLIAYVSGAQQAPRPVDDKPEAPGASK